MQGRYIVVGDLGSTGTLSIGLYDREEKRFEIVVQAHYHNLPNRPGGFIEQDPRDWKQAWIEGMKTLRQEVGARFKDVAVVLNRVAGIVHCDHMHAATFLDNNADPLLSGDGSLLQGSMMWNHCVGQEEALELRELWDEPIPARATVSRYLWFKKQFPGHLSRLGMLACPSACITHWMTGSFAVDPGDGTGMVGQLDADGQIDYGKLARIDDRLPHIVPRRVCYAGEVHGHLKSHVAKILGLPAGIPVIGGGDQSVGMVGTGAVNPLDLSVFLGNSIVANLASEAPVLNQPGLVDTFRTFIRRLYLVMSCGTSGTICFDPWVDQEAARRGGRDDRVKAAVRSELTDLAARVPAGSNGLMVLPFYNGEGTIQCPKAFGVQLGYRQCEGHEVFSLGEQVRASLEGSTMVILTGYRTTRLKAARIVASGGGSNNPLWLQILASAFNLPVYTLREHRDEGGLFGGALLMEHALRIIEGDPDSTLSEVCDDCIDLNPPIAPDPIEHGVYQDMLPVFGRAVNCLRPLFNDPWFGANR